MSKDQREVKVIEGRILAMVDLRNLSRPSFMLSYQTDLMLVMKVGESLPPSMPPAMVTM